MGFKTTPAKTESQTGSEASILGFSKRQLAKEKFLRSLSPTPVPQPKILTAEEEKAELLRIRKERHLAEQKANEKERPKKEKIWDYANSTGGFYTQLYKHDDGKINKWPLFTAMFAA